MLINANRRVLHIVYQMLDDIGTLLSPILTPAYLPLVFNAGGGKTKKALITEALETPSIQAVLLFLHAVQFVIELQSIEDLIIIEKYRSGFMITPLAQRIIKAWTAGKKSRITGEPYPAVPFLLLDTGISFGSLAPSGYLPLLALQENPTSLLKPGVARLSQKRVVLNCPGELQTAIGLLGEFMLEMPFKELRRTRLCDVVAANVSNLNALENCDVLVLG